MGNHIIKRCANLANLANTENITPHSLRRGLATGAARAQVNTVMEYIEASEGFEDSVAAEVLSHMTDK